MKDNLPPTSPTIKNWVHDPADEKAWTAFAERYAKIIEGWCLRNGLKRQDVEDMTQVIAIHIRNVINRYDNEKGMFRVWLKAITRNQCVSFLRQKDSVQSEALIGEIPALEDHIDELAKAEILAIAFAEVQSKVSARDWKIFDERHRKLKSASQLSDELGIPIAAVHQAKYRVFQLVRARVLELDGEGNSLQ